MPIFFSKENVRQSKDVERDNSEVVIFGYDKIGFSMLKSFKKMGKKFLIVDYNPEVIQHKHLKDINPEQVKKAFGGKNITVFTDTNELQAKLRSMNFDDSVLLLMSSGNFSGINLLEFAKELLK